MATLSIHGVKKSYAALEVLKEIDIELADGEFLVLLGPSGCGKSTLLNIIAGLAEPSAGEIRIGERVVNNVHPKDRDIAMVFQSYALYPNMNVAGNMEFGLAMRGVAKDARREAIQRVAKLLQIEHLLDRKPSQLSGGQRQRVAIGRALVREPKVFLFDEPLSNLDAKLRVETRIEIKRLHQRLGTTIVYVTHDQIEAMTMATRIAIMNEGAVQQYATPAEIYDHPANTYVGGFIGAPPMNFIAGRLEQSQDKLAVAIPGGHLLPVINPTPGQAAWKDRDVILGIRPEALSLANGHEAEIEAVIDVVEPTGADTLAYFLLSGRTVVARLNPRDVEKPGTTLRLAADMSRASLFDPKSGDRIG